MCTNIDIDFIGNTKVINARKHLNNSKLHLNLKSSVKLRDVFTESIRSFFPY